MANGARHHTLYAYAGQCSPQKQSALRSRSFYSFPESNSYLCPVGQQLNYGGHNARNRTHVYIVPTSTSGPANTVGRARKKRNAQAHR
jgi:hypothetical protein